MVVGHEDQVGVGLLHPHYQVLAFAYISTGWLLALHFGVECSPAMLLWRWGLGRRSGLAHTPQSTPHHSPHYTPTTTHSAHI